MQLEPQQTCAVARFVDLGLKWLSRSSWMLGWLKGISRTEKPNV